MIVFSLSNKKIPDNTWRQMAFLSMKSLINRETEGQQRSVRSRKIKYIKCLCVNMLTKWYWHGERKRERERQRVHWVRFSWMDISDGNFVTNYRKMASLTHIQMMMMMIYFFWCWIISYRRRKSRHFCHVFSPFFPFWLMSQVY